MSSFPVERIGDNRLKGLLRELQEAIDDSDNHELLRSVGVSLKLMGAEARTKAYLLDKRVGKVW